MKRFVLLMLLISLAAGCHHIHNEIAGSGKLQRTRRDVPAFTSISIEGAFDIEVVCQKPQSLDIQGDDNILPLITTEVSNNVLRIRSLRPYSVSEPITVKIAVPNLEGLSVSGAGTLEISGLQNRSSRLMRTVRLQ